jgi:hypothetical protein
MDNNIIKSLHLYINKVIHTINNNYLIYIDLEKTSKPTINKLLEYTKDINNGFIKCYIRNYTNLNNSELMTTLEYKQNYNNFIIKSFTIINNKKNIDYNKKKYIPASRNIYNNIKSIKSIKSINF